MPNADKFMLHVYAAMAEEEGRRISERTKAALASAKARGIELGRNGKTLAEKNKRDAKEFALKVERILHQLLVVERLTFQVAAKKLNTMNVQIPRGRGWHASSVYRVWKRLD